MSDQGSIFLNETTTTLPVANAEALELTRFVFQKVSVPIVTVIGVVGNILNVIILTRRQMKTSTNCYLTALAIFDMLYIIFSMSLSLNQYKDISSDRLYTYWYTYVKVLTDMCSNAAVWLTVTFTLERYIGVCHPMKGRAICTPERARILSAIAAIAAMGFTSVEFFENQVVENFSNDTNRVEHSIEPTEFGKRVSYQFGYYWFLTVAFTFLPLILLSIFNGILIRSVLEAKKARKFMSKASVTGERGRDDQQKITLMLISVVVVFLLCQLPGALLLLFQTYLEIAEVTLKPYVRNEMRIAANVTNFLVQLNASVNFILYSLMSSTFRRTFITVICPWISHGDSLGKTRSFRGASVDHRSFNNSQYRRAGGKEDLRRQSSTRNLVANMENGRAISATKVTNYSSVANKETNVV